MRDSEAGKFADMIAFVDFPLHRAYLEHISLTGQNSYKEQNGRLADFNSHTGCLEQAVEGFVQFSWSAFIDSPV